MKVVKIVKPEEPLAIENVKTPEPKGSQVLVKVQSAGVCHSDLHFWKGGYAGPPGVFMKVVDRGVVYPLIPGHEVAGVVERVGDEVEGFEIGQEVLVYPWIGDGVCPACKNGVENLCDNPRSLGVFLDGGYAEYVLIPHFRYLVDISGLDPDEVSPLACSGLTAYSAIKNADIKDGEFLVIIGAGGLGLMGIQLVKVLTNNTISVIDIDDSKLEQAKSFGADHTINSKTDDPVEEVKELTDGLGADVVIDFVNISQTAQLGINMLRKRGRLVLVGLGGGGLDLNLALIPLRAFKIIGSYTGKYADLVELLTLVKKNALKTIVSKKFKLEEANEALNQLKEGKIAGRAVLNP